MPIYEFECAACGHEFEDLVSLSADLRAVACPKCGKRRARKLLSVFAMSSRGEGRSSSSASRCTTCSSHTCSTCH
jgi:putative FmdB family regulatory protein